jgi:hypothetical protein
MTPIKRLRALIPTVGLALALVGCTVAVPGEDGNKIHRDGFGNVTSLEYGEAFTINLLEDLDDHCVDGVTGADIGTPNSGLFDPPNSVVVSCWLDEITYDDEEDPGDTTVSLWCEVDDCGNEEMTDRVIYDATSYLHTYGAGSYAAAEQYATVVRDAYDAASGRCIVITGYGAFEDDCT